MLHFNFRVANVHCEAGMAKAHPYLTAGNQPLTICDRSSKLMPLHGLNTSTNQHLMHD